MQTTGAQATSMGKAIKQINKMLSWRLSDDPINEQDDDIWYNPETRANYKCKVFLGYTSNMISCGTRETVKFLVKHRLIDAIVTTCGAIEEDIMKTFGTFHMGDFHLDGAKLRESGINRIGNILVSTELYRQFQDWLEPILKEMLNQQKKGMYWTPSKMISLLGERVNNESSVLYWCWKNKIPVYCPALTDGAVGDNIFFFNTKHEQKIRLDFVEDLNDINMETLNAKKTGIIICGGGVIKHHICNANVMRNGSDFAVYINTGFEGEASDTGASPDEAKSWGKIGGKAEPVKVWGDFTILFPLLVAQTFAKSIFSPLNERHRRPMLYPEGEQEKDNKKDNKKEKKQSE